MRVATSLAALAALASSSAVDAAAAAAAALTKPNVIVIVADDLGWHDVGFAGSNISTPHIDRFATEGVRLTGLYGQPVCSPSRAALHTARYPIAYGLQTYVIDPAGVDYGLNLNETLMPQLFRDYGGYQTHACGKWHLGMSRWEYTPTFRGYNSFHGFYSGGQDYFTHMEGAGFDLHVDSQPNCGPGCSVVDWANQGTFSTELYTSCAESVIAAHDPSNGPLFLYLPYQAVHSPDEVPQRYIDPYNATIPNLKRRTFAGMLSALDEGVGNVTSALEAKGLLSNTVIFFTADNGGPIECDESICGDSTGCTNFPLRGGKHSLWEGGVRLTSAVWAPPGVLASPGTNRSGLMHITDVLPTLLDAAGVQVPPTSHLPWSGSSQWAMISEGSASTRTEVLLNIDPLQPQGGGNGNAGIRSGDWKLLVGEVGPPWNYMPEATGPIPLAHAYGGLAVDPATGEAVLAPAAKPYPGNWPLTNMTVQLYNLADDELETTDVSASNPAVVQALLARLEYFATVVQVQPLFFNATVDPRSNPKNPGRNGTWYPWLP